MESITQAITGELIALDTSPVIYYIEEHPAYSVVTNPIFDAIDSGVCRATSSVLTLIEVLVKPLRVGDSMLADAYREILSNSENLLLTPIDQATAEIAAGLRSRYKSLRTPDAIQLASAIHGGANLIITNDDRWKRITEIRVITLNDHLSAIPGADASTQ